MEHVSFDINGKWNSIPLDLSKIHSDWQGYFDILTDYGTSEHVRGGQYQVFANAHNFVRVGGVMCHCNPMVGRIQVGHPKYDSVYYHEDFYDKLAEVNGYEIIENRAHNAFFDGCCKISANIAAERGFSPSWSDLNSASPLQVQVSYYLA